MRIRCLALGFAATLALTQPALGALISSGTQFTDGRAGTADFSIVGGSSLQIVITNTTDLTQFSGSGAAGILTQVGFTLDGGLTILGGSAVIGGTSTSVDFNGGLFGPGANMDGEWGFGNAGNGFEDAPFSVTNYVGVLGAGADKFDELAASLDNPFVLAGPQGGLMVAGYDNGGLGAIQDSVVVTLQLSGALGDLGFLNNGVVFGFASHEFNTPIPEPTSAILFGVGALLVGGAIRSKIH